MLLLLLLVLLGSSSVQAASRAPFSSALCELDGQALEMPPKQQEQEQEQEQEWIPGMQVPQFQLPTFDGVWHYSKAFGSDIVLVNLNSACGISDCMSSSNASIDALLQSGLQSEIDSFHVVFAAKDAASLSMVDAVAALLHHRLQHLRLQHQWSGRLHFVPRPLSSLYAAAAFIPSLLAQWHTPHRFVRYTLASGAASPFLPQSGKRLDAQYDWLRSPGSIGAGPHPLLSTGRVVYTCDAIDATLDLAGKVVLLQDDVSEASYAARLRSCSLRGARAVLMAAAENSALQQIGCVGDECDEELSIAAATIPFQDGTFLRYQMQSESVEVQFYSEDGDAFFVAIDSYGKLREVGWTKLPSYQHIVWAMQWHAYERKLRQRLQSDALIVKVMEQEPLHWSSSARVRLPTMDFDSVELEFQLSCPGAFDRDCGIWDRVVHVFVCCEDGFGCGRACPPTNLPGNQTCGNELGRWITPFRRRIGHWLTDVTALAPLLSSQTCTFSARTSYASAPWRVSLNLRLKAPRPKQQRHNKPSKLLELFRGGTFDHKYNERKSVQLHIPSTIVRASLVMVISGHGSDDNNCAEFCVSSHRFVFNGMESDAVVNELSDAGSPLGCANRVLEGVEPNQHGTWLYGRGGWCDGLPVEPWTRDVSALLTMGASNRVQYDALFNGRPPNPKRAPGYIVLYSYLALYEQAHEDEPVQFI